MAKGEIVVWAIVAFLTGALAAGFNIGYVLLLTMVAMVAVMAALKWRFLISAIFCVSLLAGWWYYFFFFNFRAAREAFPENGESLRGIIVDEPFMGFKSQIFTLELEKPYRGKIKVFVPQTPVFSYGDEVELFGRIKPRERLNELYAAVFPKVVLLAEWRGSMSKRFLFDVRDSAVAVFKSRLRPDSAALISGLTLGVRADFSEKFKEEMRLSGTTHLVALSGYNIAVLIGALSITLGKILSRRANFLATLLILLLFVVMVGAQASVVRAGIMGFLLVLARQSGRMYDFGRAVIVAALFMVLWNPGVLRFDTGFQLSFMSLFGITFITPAIGRFWREPKGELWGDIRENALLSIGAQIAVIPILLSTFREFSLSAVAANMLILPFVPFIMFLGFALVFLGLIWAPLGFFASWILVVPLSYFRSIIAVFANITIPVRLSASFFTFIAYYCSLLGIWFKLYSKHAAK